MEPLYQRTIFINYILKVFLKNLKINFNYNYYEILLSTFINSEYMDAVGEQMIDWSVWSFSVTNETKQLAGALGSLVKKGFCSCDISENDETCALTSEGYYWAKNNGLCL